ncbi:MAG: hypothetical protein MJB12_04600 [Firmicutes bacterium]|nr:hypothetical protein [Bacillota bacterium]
MGKTATTVNLGIDFASQRKTNSYIPYLLHFFMLLYLTDYLILSLLKERLL